MSKIKRRELNEHIKILSLKMQIGFDAKRAFHNTTGLGNYSRDLIDSFHQFYPENHLYLFNPKPNQNLYLPPSQNCQEINPKKPLAKLFSSIWRRKWMVDEIKKNKLSHFHGLSHELPIGLEKINIKKIVTIHDLIFEHFPTHFNKNDVWIYRKKFKHACQIADKIIAVSTQTKKDLVALYNIDATKISCIGSFLNPRFNKIATDLEKHEVQKKFNLPDEFLLSVGSIIERKNLLQVCKALAQLKSKIKLVIVGKGGKYKQKIHQFISDEKLENQVFFLEDNFNSADINVALPIIYQLAIGSIYISIYEGFGLPVIESLASGTPVITSNISCLPEAGGDAAIYVNPLDINEIIASIEYLFSSGFQKTEIINKGLLHVHQFSPETVTKELFNLYNSSS